MQIGPINVTRDGALLWFLAGASIVGYLTAARIPPTEWGYHEWLQFATAFFAWGVGKLQRSMLSSTAEVNRGISAEGKPLEGTPV